MPHPHSFKNVLLCISSRDTTTSSTSPRALTTSKCETFCQACGNLMSVMCQQGGNAIFLREFTKLLIALLISYYQTTLFNAIIKALENI